jgi:putative transposase
VERDRAMARCRILKPHLEEDVSLREVIAQNGLALRTAQRWVRQYRVQGLAALCRKTYAGKRRHRLSVTLQEVIQGLALQRPPLSVAAVHRKAASIAQRLGEHGRRAKFP